MALYSQKINQAHIYRISMGIGIWNCGGGSKRYIWWKVARNNYLMPQIYSSSTNKHAGIQTFKQRPNFCMVSFDAGFSQTGFWLCGKINQGLVVNYKKFKFLVIFKCMQKHGCYTNAKPHKTKH